MLVGFLKGLLMTATLYAITSVGFHWLMGVPLFWLTGLMAGLLYAVPYVGLLIVVVVACGSVVLMGAPMPFLLFFEPSVWFHALLALVGIVGLNFVFDWLVMPRFVGQTLGLRTSESIVAMLIGAKLGGVWGAMLAVPLGALFKRLVIRSRTSPIVMKPPSSEPDRPAETEPPQPNHSK